MGESNLRDTLYIIALGINILVSMGTILKIVQWIVKVNISIEQTASAVREIVASVNGLTNWKVEVDKRHAIEDATKQYKTT